MSLAAGFLGSTGGSSGSDGGLGEGGNGLGDYLRALDGLDGGVEDFASPVAAVHVSAGRRDGGSGLVGDAVFCTADRVDACADELADVIPSVLALTGDGGVPRAAQADAETVRTAITLLSGLGETDGAVAVCNLLQQLVQRCTMPGGNTALAPGSRPGGYSSGNDPAEALQRLRRDTEGIREERDRLREEVDAARHTARALKEQIRVIKADHEQALKAAKRERDVLQRKVAGFGKREDQFKHEIRKHEQQYEKLKLRVQELMSGKEPPVRRGGGAAAGGGAEVAALKRRHEEELNSLLAENDEIRDAYDELQQDLSDAVAEREELVARIEELEDARQSQAGAAGDGEEAPRPAEARAVPSTPSAIPRHVAASGIPSPGFASPSRRQWKVDAAVAASPKVDPGMFAVHNTENSTN